LRIKYLEDTIQELTLEERGKKRVRGGDRAGWLRIRDEDLPTREEWCIEGGVFGLYSDGVGRIVPQHIRPRRSVVVYSTDPDTVEEHPDPTHPDNFVRIVLVGEAPIKLRENEYQKLKRLRCMVDVYVNHMGEVCIRSFDQDPAPGGMVFATTDWSQNYEQDEEGYPIFQGVRGVCGKIQNFQTHKIYNPTGMLKLARDLSGTVRDSFRYFERDDDISISPEKDTLDFLLKKRDELNRRLGDVERERSIFKACKQHREALEIVRQQNLQQMENLQRQWQSIGTSDSLLASTRDVYSDLIARLTQSNEDIDEILIYLQGQSEMNVEKYRPLKDKIEANLEKIKTKIKKAKK
jgi:hypothetical protein